MCKLDVKSLKKELQQSLTKGHECIMKVLEKAYGEYEADFDTNEGICGKIKFSETDYMLFPNKHLETFMYENQLENFPISHWTGSIGVYRLSLFCATSPLSVILENIGDNVKNLKHGHIFDSFNYFLVNPREEVVNWALDNKEYIFFDDDNWEQFESFIRIHQSNPVLRDKVLDAFKKEKSFE